MHQSHKYNFYLKYSFNKWTIYLNLFKFLTVRRIFSMITETLSMNKMKNFMCEVSMPKFYSCRLACPIKEYLYDIWKNFPPETTLYPDFWTLHRCRWQIILLKQLPSIVCQSESCVTLSEPSPNFPGMLWIPIEIEKHCHRQQRGSRSCIFWRQECLYYSMYSIISRDQKYSATPQE